MAEESKHFRVVVRVEEVDKDGNCVDVGSERVVADFENDDDGESIGIQSDNFFNILIRLSEGI